MNDRFTEDNRDEAIAQKLNQVAEQTRANPQFAAELEERLRNAHRPKGIWFTASFKQISPVLRWVALMILLGLVLSLSIKTLIPAPQPAVNGTPVKQETPTPLPDNKTPVPHSESFDYDGAQLIMSVPFPDAPAQTNLYTALRSKSATAEFARTLAAQFGIEGEVYTNPTQGQSPNGDPLVVTDGKQQLLIYSQNNYIYTSDLVKYSRNNTTFSHENAEAIIREYLQAHGFNFNFRVEPEGGPSGGYVLRQLSPDGLPMMSETQGSTRITLDEEGNILSFSMSIIDYEPASLGNFKILTAREALKQMVAETFLGGSVQSGGSVPDPSAAPPQYWYHDYPDHQTVTVYGSVLSYPAVDSNTPAIMFIENVPVIGSTSGMETLSEYAYIQATGQFVVENGVRKFNIEAWTQEVQMTCATGSARRAGEQVIITNQTEGTSEYNLVDPPSDLPLNTTFPDTQLVSCGVILDGQFYWTSIQYYTDPSQMGGGGGGGGFFYQLNLSSTPVPFPTVTPAQPSAYSSAELSAFPKYMVQSGDTLQKIAAAYNVSAEDILQANGMSDPLIAVGSTLIIPTTRLEGERGVVDVQVFAKPDGRQRTSYTFVTERDQTYYQLKGDTLEALQKTINRPIKIWGDLSVDETGVAFITVEKSETLYPDLQFQILTGIQETKEIDGAEAILFTTGGTTYMQLRPDGGYPDYNYSGNHEEVMLETLQVPDETYAGYPAIRVFMMAPAINPATGKPMELTGTAEKIEVLPDPYGNADQYVSPDTIIEKVELVYYVSDPSSYDQTLEPGQIYLQPVWYFHGHNDNGDEVNIFIQALRQEYLLPETQP